MTVRRALAPFLAGLLVASMLPTTVAGVGEIVLQDRTTSVEPGGTVTVTLVAAFFGGATETPSATLIVSQTPLHGELGEISATTCGIGVAGCWATITYTPEPGFEGEDLFRYNRPGETPNQEADVLVTVGASTAAPTTAAEPTQAAVEDEARFGTHNLLANDTDLDGDSLTAELAEGPAHGTVTVFPNGEFRYHGDPDYSAFAHDGSVSDTFTYRAVDGVHVSAARTVNVLILEVNDPPSFTSGGDVSVAEDSGARTVTGWASAIRAGSVWEEPFQTVTFTVTAGDPTLFDVQPAIAAEPTPGPAATSNLTFTPKAGRSGTTTVTVVAMDDGGTGGGRGDDTSDPVTFKITITADQDAPTANADTADTAEDVTTDIGVLLNDVDPDGDTLSIQSVADPANGSATIDGSTVRYTPDADWNGTDVFTYVVADSAGGTETGSVSVDVAPVDDPPSFTAGPDITVAEDAGAQTRVGWATAIRVGGPDEAPAQAAVFSIASNSNTGLFSAGPAVSAAGTLTFTPRANTSGTADVTLRLSDGVSHAEHAFAITVTGASDPPNAVNDTGIAVPALSASTPIPVLANDLNADPGETLAIVAVTQGAKGRVAITGGGTGLTYAPTACNVGTDTFTYTLSDGNGGVDTATVLLSITRDTVRPMASPPNAAFVVGTALGTSTVPVRVSWCATDPGSGVARYHLQHSVDAKAYSTLETASPKSTSITRNLSFGHRYQFRVRAVDGDGSVGLFGTGPALLVGRVQETSTAIAYTGTWTSVASATASGGRVRYTTRADASATFSFTGRAVAIVSPTSASRGSFKVYVDGVLVGTVSEKTSSTIVRRVVFARPLTPGTHTLKLVASGNGRIDLDAIVTLR